MRATARSTLRHQHKAPIPKPLRRKLHFDRDGRTEMWSYSVESTGVRIRWPDSARTEFVDMKKIEPRYWEEDPEYGMGPYRAGITPSLIKDYIEVVFIKQEIWDPAARVGGVMLGGRIVQMTKERAEAIEKTHRDTLELPLRILLQRASKHDWLSVKEMEQGLRNLVGDDLRRAVDRIISMWQRGMLDQLGENIDPDTRFRLKWVLRDPPVPVPQVAVFQPKDAPFLDWLREQGDASKTVGGRLYKREQQKPAWHREYEREPVIRYAVPRGGYVVIIEDTDAFTRFCSEHELNPKLRDAY